MIQSYRPVLLALLLLFAVHLRPGYRVSVGEERLAGYYSRAQIRSAFEAAAQAAEELTPGEAASAFAAVKGVDDVRCAGAPFHTAVASERSKREINILSGISLFCVVLFGWLLARSFRFLPVLVATLAAAFCVATAAVFAVFPKPHLMTFVFGTSLIGLSVDYVYHAWTATRESVAKPLTFSFFSTAACFLPLFFSGVDVLGQMALFTVAGLAAAYAGVMVFGKRRRVVECLSEGCFGGERLGNGRTGTFCRRAVFG